MATFDVPHALFAYMTRREGERLAASSTAASTSSQYSSKSFVVCASRASQPAALPKRLARSCRGA